MEVFELLFDTLLLLSMRLFMNLGNNTKGAEGESNKLGYEGAKNPDIFFTNVTETPVPNVKNVERFKIESARV